MYLWLSNHQGDLMLKLHHLSLNHHRTLNFTRIVCYVLYFLSWFQLIKWISSGFHHFQSKIFQFRIVRCLNVILWKSFESISCGVLLRWTLRREKEYLLSSHKLSWTQVASSTIRGSDQRFKMRAKAWFCFRLVRSIHHFEWIWEKCSVQFSPEKLQTRLIQGWFCMSGLEWNGAGSPVLHWLFKSYRYLLRLYNNSTGKFENFHLKSKFFQIQRENFKVLGKFNICFE